MKSWLDIYNISNHMLCLQGVKCLEDFLLNQEVSSFRIKVKREISRGMVLSGYADLEMSIENKEFNHKFLVSWDSQKFEPINFWLTVLREKYTTCQNTEFYNELIYFNQEIKSTWENISSWIVKNNDVQEIILDKNSNLKNEILGENFKINHDYAKLNLLLEINEIKEKLKKI